MFDLAFITQERQEFLKSFIEKEGSNLFQTAAAYFKTGKFSYFRGKVEAIAGNFSTIPHISPALVCVSNTWTSSSESI